MSGTSARPVRHLPPPDGWRERLFRHRFTLARRATQVGVLLLFFGTAHWGFRVAGRPLLAGNLSAASLGGSVPLADPFAVLQMLLSGHALAAEVLVGAAVVLAAYAALGGRTFCAWVCPMNVVTDAAEQARSKFGPARDVVRLTPRLRYAALGIALLMSALGGVAAFEWLSPIAMLHRELVFGAGLGLTAAAGIFAFDFAVVRRGWCGHVCPLGAFWALVGRVAGVRIAFDATTCTRCGDCVRACPEPQVLGFRAAAARGMVASGECTNCGRCVAVCPEGSLEYSLRIGAAPGARPLDQGEA